MTTGRSGALADWSSTRLGRRALGELEPFDEGGEGSIFQLHSSLGPSRLPALYKEYKLATRRQLDRGVLQEFVDFVRSLPPSRAAWLYERAAWPTWIVEDDGAEEADLASVTGIVIPHAPSFFVTNLQSPTGGHMRVPAKFELLLNGKDFLESVGVEISMRQRLEVLAAAAETMSFFHSQGFSVGDFSCKNILFSLNPRPSCFFIDCDSMLIGGRSALPPGETPEWELPLGEELGTSAGDRYKFALLVLRMHTGAQHHRDPHRLPVRTHPELRRLVQASLSRRAIDRPLISEWSGPLTEAAAALPHPLPPATTGPPTTHTSPAAARPRRSQGVRSTTVSITQLSKAGAAAEGHPSAQVMALFCRLGHRRFTAPPVRRLVWMLVGLWAACAVAFGAACLAGMDPNAMDTTSEVGLFSAYGLFAACAFVLTTTEPRHLRR